MGKMKIEKRNGSTDTFDITKIIAAISAANKEVDEQDQISMSVIRDIAGNIADTVTEGTSVEDIQDKVEDDLLEHEAYKLAKKIY